MGVACRHYSARRNEVTGRTFNRLPAASMGGSARYLPWSFFWVARGHKGVVHKIYTPWCSVPYKLWQRLKSIKKIQLRMLEELSSSWHSPCWWVISKVRWGCAVLHRFSQPSLYFWCLLMPQIDALLDLIGQAWYLSILDLMHNYWH